jgi:CRP-like cAMP-binding protein
MDLNNSPVFRDIPSKLLDTLLEIAHKRDLAPGETLFQEGDDTDHLYILASGRCMTSRAANPLGLSNENEILDAVPTLGGLPHTIRAVAVSTCEFLYWQSKDLLEHPEFSAAARKYLATALNHVTERLDQLESPVNYATGTHLNTGPFVFKNTTLILAFCEANLEGFRSALPEGLTLFRPAWRKHDAVLLALAKFPSVYPEHSPNAHFTYSETTCFVPVRHHGRVGLLPQFIYPSTWEPILLGREIYGFPKQLGVTRFGENEITLTVDGAPNFQLHYSHIETAGEPRLVRAFSDWIGFEGRLTAAAFRAGDMLLDIMRTPLYRRLAVYNHKRIPAADTTVQTPIYAVDQLTQAVFSVAQWHKISKLRDPALVTDSGPIASLDITLREAYFTVVDMRLSTGRIVRDYLKERTE